VRRLGTLVVALLIAVAVSACAGLGVGGAAPAPSGGPLSAGHTLERATTAKGTHKIFMINRTEETIWPAAWPGSISGQTGWMLPAGAGTSFTVPVGWNARVWGRTGCHFGGASSGCRTGDCDGRYQCDGWGEIPATLAEYNLDSFAELDFYDVSMVDGSNLPMYIRVIHGNTSRSVDANGCLEPGICTHEVQCPRALRVPKGSRHPDGCISPCARFGTNRYCCRGKFAAHCNPARTWPIDYAAVFARAEPFAYSWSGDDASGVFTCSEGCDYEIVWGVSPPGRLNPPI
jgi:hypothetical protein